MEYSLDFTLDNINILDQREYYDDLELNYYNTDDELELTVENMNIKDFNIFGKQEDNPNTFTLSQIYENIPKDSKEYPDPVLSKYKIEMRWRFYEFPNQKVKIQISIKDPKKERLYCNSKGEFIVLSDNLDIYDKYVIKEYYYYY